MKEGEPMKRAFVIVLLLALMLAALPAVAYAVGPAGFGPNFVDADEDGICDRACTEDCSFVDEDRDGICDNRPTQPRSMRGCGGYGSGCGYRSNGCGRGQGRMR